MKTEVVRVSSIEEGRAAITAAAERLRRGEVVVVPTETVYGIAALPAAEAVLRAAKGRDEGKPFTWAFASLEAAAAVVDLAPRGLAKLAHRFWPGPLTLIAARRDGTGTLGVRVPGHPVALALLTELGVPYLLTSANQSGKADARDADEALRALEGRVALILDAGPAQLREASAVVSFTGERAIVHREGILDRATLLRTAARQILLVCSGNTCRSPMAEGLLRKRWALRLGIPIEQLLEHGVMVTSVGTEALPGLRAADEAVALLAAQGVDLRTHRARAITPELVHNADQIFTMTAAHRRALLKRSPDAAEKAALLDPDGKDIPDPIGGGVEAYRRALDAIGRALERRLAEFA